MALNWLHGTVLPLLTIAVGAVVGLAYGVLGAGGSAFATPLLAMVGVPGLAAVASPLPATIPAAILGAWRHRGSGAVDFGVAARLIALGVPAALAGAAASPHVGGRALLVLSGLVLVALGVRMIGLWRARNVQSVASDGNEARPTSTVVLVGGSLLIGFATGLLANGGGFLLVPFLMLALGFDMHRAAGTSLAAAAAFTVPTVVVHAVIGNINWPVAAAFAVGLAPASYIGAMIAPRLAAERVHMTFAVMLLGLGLWFTASQLT